MAEEKTVQKENPMGTRPINSLLISMSLPIMISMIVQPKPQFRLSGSG